MQWSPGVGEKRGREGAYLGPPQPEAIRAHDAGIV